MRRYKVTAPDALVIPREEFFRYYWNYKSGEHVTFAGPTGWGKTRLLNGLLSVTANRRLNAVVLCMKNRDKETDAFLRDTPGFFRTHTWPPRVSDRVRAGTFDIRGWVLWPTAKIDPDDRANVLYKEFRAAFLDSLKKGRRILVADDMIALNRWLGLNRDFQYLYWNGRSDDVGIWGSIQRPAFAPTEAYSQVQHVFLARSREKRDRDRYREVGGIDPDTLTHNLDRCEKYQWLYIHHETGTICIVDK